MMNNAGKSKISLNLYIKFKNLHGTWLFAFWSTLALKNNNDSNVRDETAWINEIKTGLLTEDSSWLEPQINPHWMGTRQGYNYKNS